MKHDLAKQPEVPAKVTISEYDKLLRRIWELEQKYKYDEKQTINAVSLDMVFEKQEKIEQRLSQIEAELKKHQDQQP